MLFVKLYLLMDNCIIERMEQPVSALSYNYTECVPLTLR